MVFFGIIVGTLLFFFACITFIEDVRILILGMMGGLFIAWVIATFAFLT